MYRAAAFGQVWLQLDRKQIDLGPLAIGLEQHDSLFLERQDILLILLLKQNGNVLLAQEDILLLEQQDNHRQSVSGAARHSASGTTISSASGAATPFRSGACFCHGERRTINVPVHCFCHVLLHYARCSFWGLLDVSRQAGAH